MMRLEGTSLFLPGGTCQGPHCPSVPSGSQPLYRCDECMQLTLICHLCCLRQHANRPFHIIKVMSVSNTIRYEFKCRLPQAWNGYFFRNVSLGSIGLLISLGHSGGSCPI